MQDVAESTTNRDVLPIYTREEVEKETLKYFKGDQIATDVWINKYCLKDSDGNLYELTPDDTHRRLAREFARIEKKYPNPLSEEEIYIRLKNFERIVPQGSPMSGIGNNFQVVSLSNCFVIGDGYDSDSYGGIFMVDEMIAQLQKRRGGVGCDISHLRPSGTPVKNSAITSTGAHTFMQRFSNTTEEVAQDGRRGALMETISIKHPNSEDFIDMKAHVNPVTGKKDKVTGANVSVKIHDDFMDAVINNKPYTQQFPINSKNPQITKEVDAKKIWDKIIHNAWDSAEPGCLFWNTIIRESVPDCYDDFKTVSTNPCGEIPLCIFDSCRLLLQNLYSYVVNPFREDAYFDWEQFEEDNKIAMRLMDDLIDLEIEKINQIIDKIKSDPEPEMIKSRELYLWEQIREKAINGRRTGLGITAEGDMLAALGLRYGSEEGIDFSEKVHETLKLNAYRSSVEMAKERGAFPVYDWTREKDNPFINRIKDADPNLYQDMVEHGRRNIALLTIAPAGSMSILTQTTSGIENTFKIYYIRKRKINPNDKGARVDETDAKGVSWQDRR